MTKDEILALAEVIGVNEAARRTGKPSGSIKRWRYEARQKDGANRTEPNREAGKGPPVGAKKGDPDGQRIVGGGDKATSAPRARMAIPPADGVEVPDENDVQLHAALTVEQSVVIHLLLAGHRDQVFDIRAEEGTTEPPRLVAIRLGTNRDGKARYHLEPIAKDHPLARGDDPNDRSNGDDPGGLYG